MPNSLSFIERKGVFLYILWIEGSKRPYAYHVTYLKNIDDIGNSAWTKEHLLQHSQKGVFFCHHLSDNPIEDELIPIILRFNLNPTKSKKDIIGDLEYSGSKFVSREIPSVGIQMWDGREWIDDIDSDMIYIYKFANDAYDDNEQEILTIDSGYPLPPELL